MNNNEQLDKVEKFRNRVCNFVKNTIELRVEDERTYNYRFCECLQGLGRLWTVRRYSRGDRMNIYDIAKLSGVSIATVSRVVNGSPRVSEKTKQKVLAVMEEAEYTPNVFARGLGLNSMKTIGILCPDISDQYMAEAVSHLEKRLHEYGYDCILSCSGSAQEAREHHTKLLLSKRIDTLILVGSLYAGSGKNPGETEYVRAAAQQVPVFMINGYVEGENIYCSYGDDQQGAYDVTQALIRRGKKRILFLYDSQTYSARQKMQGYESALADAGYPILGDLKHYIRPFDMQQPDGAGLSDFSESSSGYMQNKVLYVKEMLLAHRTLEFDSVFACNDGLAVGVLKYARAKGLSVPEELSVAGYNNSTMAVCCEPELTSVDNQVKRLCSDAVDRILKVLQGEEDVEQNHKVRCEIVRRCSTDF